MTLLELVEALQQSSNPDARVTILCSDGYYYDISKVHINSDGSAVLDEDEELEGV